MPPPPPTGPRELVISDCRSECAWDATGETLDGERLFACEACGSEWVPSEPWTPIDHTGNVPDAVAAVRSGSSGSSGSSG